MISSSTYRTLFLSGVGALALDQGSKFLAQRITTVALNTGISFSLFQSTILTGILIVVLVGIWVGFGTRFAKASAIATGFFFGASLSNIIDRLLFGGVRDFLPVPLLHVTNNIADWLIVLSLAWILWKSEKKSAGTV